MNKVLKNVGKKMFGQRMNLHDHEMEMLAEQRGYVTQKTAHRELSSLIRKLSPVISEGQKMIRLGPKGDGGYLVPDDLTGIEAIFSPGVEQVSGFEKDCADLGMKVFLADKSVDKPAESHELFDFTEKYIGAVTNDEFMTMDDWVGSSLTEDQSDLLLQIDIEGAEYETFFRMSDNLIQRFRIIVAEFHYLDQLRSLPFFLLASRVFDKILQTHTCVHIHPNNCCGSMLKDGIDIPAVAEFTFLRSDRIRNPSYASVFPHPLDCDNTDKPPLTLAKCWYSNT